jgi:hypothetical protein
MEEWKLRRNDQEYPVGNVEMLRSWTLQGNVAESDYVYNPVLQRWMYARELAEIADIFHNRQRPVQPAKGGTSLATIGCAAVLLIVMIGVVMNAITGGSDGSGTSAVGRSTRGYADAKVHLVDYSWSRGGFDAILMIDFTIKNDGDRAIKDFTIECEGGGGSGTRVDRNRKVVYERLAAGASRSFDDFNMGFLHSQVQRVGCKVTDVVFD